MRNHILTTLFVVITIFIIFINSNAEASIKAMLKADINDKKLVARQTIPEKLRCDHYPVEKLRKSNDSDIDVPKDTIFARFIIECNVKSVKVSVANYSLEKFDTNGQWVGMMGASTKQLGNKGVPKNIGSFIIDSFLLSANPSECLNAPNYRTGILAKANMCFSYDIPKEYTIPLFSQPCARVTNTVTDCPPNSPGKNTSKNSSSSSSSFSPLSFLFSILLFFHFFL
ncbi:hypothetical protein RclHR1_00080021 [Rhizophagus clarus]|uniref:Uncharacterized protein n=1 Tax=Rhizophagus clarus TaxID=94130 RepID=A0A2Z6RZC3_9GLOM|nr:hypothetical protein RclHR1_00080021 [Rhizophagus clarus]GET04056.1 hypothetical protein GLOIN_2v1561294 [Rhizophagus clarus]